MADEKNLNEKGIADAARDAAAKTENAADKANDIAETVKDKADDVIDDIKDKADDVKKTAENVIKSAENDLNEMVEGLENDAKDVFERAEEEIKDMADGIENAIEGQSEDDARKAEVDEAVAQALAERDAQDAAIKAKKNKRLKIAACIAGAVIIVGGVVLSGFVSKTDEGGITVNTYDGWLPKLVNKYNHMGFVDITGNTIGGIAKSSDTSVEDFKKQFGLPDDMPASTIEMAAMYMLPAKNYGMMYGIDFATMKDLMHIPDTTEDGTEITEDTPWGVVQGEIAIADYIGDTGDGAALKDFKDEFGFGDEITGETKWKEVRNVVDEKTRQDTIESKKKAAQDAEDDAADTVDIDDSAADTADGAADAAADTADGAADAAADNAADGAAADTADTAADAAPAE